MCGAAPGERADSLTQLFADGRLLSPASAEWHGSRRCPAFGIAAALARAALVHDRGTSLQPLRHMNRKSLRIGLLPSSNPADPISGAVHPRVRQVAHRITVGETSDNRRSQDLTYSHYDSHARRCESRAPHRAVPLGPPVPSVITIGVPSIETDPRRASGPLSGGVNA